MIETRFSAQKDIDILIFAEGTYPFVRGGVSSWIFQIISNLSNYKFGVIFLGSFEGSYQEYLFPIPDNLIHLQVVYLFEKEEKTSPELPKEKKSEAFPPIKRMHDIFKESHGCPHGLSDPITDIGKMLENETGFSYLQFLRSEQSWNFICEQYSRYSTNPSFLDYFWNIRNMHAPLWRMEKALHVMPKTKVLHTISTGYAGLLAAMAHQRFGYPLILSEHGLYSKERSIELLQTKMFPKIDRLIANSKVIDYQHQVWLSFFDSLARVCYHYANPIISLYDAARQQQQAAGALAKKTKVISNGVDVARFRAIKRPVDAPIPKIVCFIGRVVRIKDIKTLIRSVAIMTEKDKEIKVWLRMIGNEDPDYFQECLDYIALLGQENNIEFIEIDNMETILSQIGLLILSSISEGMPLVLLESLAAGIPAITTAVGSCREIIEGREEEDPPLGTCGSIVSIANASMLAEEAIKFLNNPSVWRKASEVGIQRIEKYYDQTIMFKAYTKIYNKAIKNGRDRD